MPQIAVAAGHRCSYGTIEFESVLTKEYSRHPVYSERGRYMWTRVVLSIEAVVNPKAMSYDDQAPADPVYQEDKSPAETEEAIRYYLETPRRELVYQIGNWDVLNTAIVGEGLRQAALDCNLGPTPLRVAVRKVHGSRTFQIEFQVETYLNESQYYKDDGQGPGLTIVENSWHATDSLDVNDHYRCRRTISGQAFFRTDRLHALNKIPDDWRVSLIHPVPPGFRRENVNIDITQAGNEMRYTIVDVEDRLNIKARNIVKIEASHTVGQKSLDLARIGAAGWSALQMMVQGVAAVRQNPPQSRWQRWGAYTGAVAGPALPFLSLSFPGEEHLVRVAVWGDTEVNSAYCAHVAYGCALVQATGANVNRAMFTLNLSEHRDLVLPFAEVTIQAIECSLNAVARYRPVALGGDGSRSGVIPNVSHRFPAEGLGENGGVASVIHPNTSQDPGVGPSRSGGTRGRATAALAAQVLADPTMLITRPTTPRPAGNENPA